MSEDLFKLAKQDAMAVPVRSALFLMITGSTHVGTRTARTLLDLFLSEHAHALAEKIRAADMDYWADKAADMTDPEKD